MVGDRDVHDTTSIMGQQHKDEEQAARGGGHDEEVSCHELVHVVRQEGPPRLRGWSLVPDDVFSDGRLRDRHTEFQQLAVNARGTPQRIGCRHCSDQHADFSIDLRPTSPVSALPAPVQAKPSPMPADDGFGFDHHERRPPLPPDSRAPDPEQPVEPRQAKSTPVRSFKDLKLMPQYKDLELQDRARTTAISKRRQKRPEDCHVPAGYSGTETQLQWFQQERRFWQGQHPATAPSLRVRPLPCDELPMPAENRVGRNDRRDLTEPTTAQPVSVPRQPPAFLVGQTDPAGQVRSEDAVLFDQVGHGVLLPLVEPADQRHQKHSEGQRIEHGGRVYPTSPIVEP